MHYFNFNGKILPANSPVISSSNRGLRYGDGLFETMKFAHKDLILEDEHFARLWKGMALLKFDIPKLFTPEFLMLQIKQLLQKNKFESARVRLEIIRGDGGLYDTKSHAPIFIIETWKLDSEYAALNENGLQMCIYADAKKTIDHFSNIKHNNYLPYFMAALYAKEQQCNDAVVLNQHDRICDSTIANIFLVSNEKIYTPSLAEGCISGVMRRFIIQTLAALGMPVEETAITKDFLLNADEVFLTNSIYNLRWVAAIEQKKYSNVFTKKIFDSLAKTNPLVFC